MNFKGYKKIAEDKHTATMKHDKGHTLVIAISALPKIHREALKRLPLHDGGDVLASGSKQGISEQGRQVRHGEKATEEAKGRATMERMTKPKMKGLAKGGEVRRYAKGDEVQASEAPTDQESPAQDFMGSEFNTAPVSTPGQNGTPAAPSNLSTSSNINPAAMNQNTQTAADLQSNVESSGAAANLQAKKAEMQAQADMEQRRQERLNDYSNHVNEFSEAYQKGMINPNAVFDKMGTGQKVSTAIGLMLGGMAPSFGGHDYSTDWLNNQINRDIDAQKTNQGYRKNILDAYENLYGKGVAADGLTAASIREAYSNNVMKHAQELGTPAAISKAMLFKNQQLAKQQQDLKAGAMDVTDMPGFQRIQQPQQGGGAAQPMAPRAPMAKPNQGAATPRAPAQPLPFDAYKALNIDPYADDRDQQVAKLNFSPGDRARLIQQNPHRGDDEPFVAPPISKLSSPKDEAMINHLDKNEMYGMPNMFHDQMPTLHKEYDSLQKADVARSEGRKFFNEIAARANGPSGRLYRTFDPNSPGAIGGGLGLMGGLKGAGIGAGIGEAVGHIGKMGVDTGANRNREAYVKAFSAILANAIPGLTPTEAHSTAESMTPVEGDTNKQIADKFDIFDRKTTALNTAPTLERMRNKLGGKK